jgi:ribosome-binding factor A
MKKTKRTAQLGEMLRADFAHIFSRELTDLDLGFMTVLDVEVAPDLSYARIYLSSLDSHEIQDEKLERINRAKSKIRRMIAARSKLRRTPELEFKIDRTAERAARVETLLRENPPLPVEDDPIEESEENES